MAKSIKDIKQVTGYCIMCGNNIPLDISIPFCSKCNSTYINKKRYEIFKGIYCHSCKVRDESISDCYPLCKECRLFDRDDNSIDEHYLKKINEYKNMSLIERQTIKAHWSNENDIFSYEVKHNCVLKYVKMTEVLKIIESDGRLNTKDVFSNEPKSNRRIMNALGGWKNGVTIEPPSIVFDEPIHFKDGRHRTLAYYFLGMDIIPVYCFKNSIKSAPISL